MSLPFPPSPSFASTEATCPVEIPSGAPRPRLTFIGTGYLGTTYAICFAELGYEVLGFDVDEGKIAKLAAGEVPFHEPGLDELLRRNANNGRLRFTTDWDKVAEFGDVHFICVGTPQLKGGMAADLSYVEASVTALSQRLTRKVLIIGKSTVPVGTAEWVEELVGKHAPAGVDAEVVWSPEFLQEGHAVEDVLRPNRLILGVKSAWAHAMFLAAHKGVFDLGATEDREVPLVVTDFATAELVKVAANAFLATKISFINAMAEVCEAVGADVTQLARAIGYDDRIGKKFLRSGIGFGGACLPKDIRAFQARAQELGVGEALRLLHEVDLINTRRQARVIQLAAELLGRPYGPGGPNLSGLRVAVLGTAFKANTDDVRESPAIAIIRSLHRTGAHVCAYDPEAVENARREFDKIEYVYSMQEAVRGADLVCVLTDWNEFRYADPAVLGELVNAKRVIDGMNCLDVDAWVSAGWQLRGMGRPAP